MDLDSLPDDPLARLASYQRARAEEERLVAEALAVPPAERTPAQEAAIAYSPLGTAAGCKCGGKSATRTE